MNILTIVIIIFVLLELSNVIILYFVPESQKGNGIATFKSWELSKSDPDLHLFIQYMLYWVAGTKLIFIVLLCIILLLGDNLIKLFTVIGLVLTISTFYWKLLPIIELLDSRDMITPKGYSKTLKNIITIFISVFALSALIYLFIHL